MTDIAKTIMHQPKHMLGLKWLLHDGCCQLCQSALADYFLCQACIDAHQWLLPPKIIPLDTSSNAQKVLSIYAASDYAPPLSYAIAAFKDKQNNHTLPYLLYALTILADHLSKTIATDGENVAILPVPTTTKRLIWRGFYPVLHLAQYLAKMTNFVLYTDVMRPKESVAQRGLSATARTKNVKNVFVLKQLPPAHITHVVLFDDVATTGATLQSLAQTVLMHDGNLKLSACCIAST